MSVKRAVENALSSVSLDPPIDVRAALQSFGITVRVQPMESGVSGMLVVNASKATIAVNSEHSAARQRFTLAHELGHYLLHRKEQNVFVDAPLYRNKKSSLGTDRLEVEANAFASAFLLPEKLLGGEVKAPVDPLDEAQLQHLASRYAVSVQAVVYRLMRLNLMAE